MQDLEESKKALYTYDGYNNSEMIPKEWAYGSYWNY